MLFAGGKTNELELGHKSNVALRAKYCLTLNPSLRFNIAAAAGFFNFLGVLLINRPRVGGGGFYCVMRPTLLHKNLICSILPTSLGIDSLDRLTPCLSGQCVKAERTTVTGRNSVFPARRFPIKLRSPYERRGPDSNRLLVISSHVPEPFRPPRPKLLLDFFDGAGSMHTTAVVATHCGNLCGSQIGSQRRTGFQPVRSSFRASFFETLN